MKKSNAKNSYIPLLIVVVIIAASISINKGQDGFRVASLIFAPIFLLSIIVRNNQSFEFYFTSKYNIFTAKTRYEQEFDFSRDILFEKLIEVMTEARFKIRRTDKVTGHIFATAPISWYSWGENIYINLKEENGKTTLDFCSACLFQIYSWGKNERNYDHFLGEFEKSLTI